MAKKKTKGQHVCFFPPKCVYALKKIYTVLVPAHYCAKLIYGRNHNLYTSKCDIMLKKTRPSTCATSSQPVAKTGCHDMQYGLWVRE